MTKTPSCAMFAFSSDVEKWYQISNEAIKTPMRVANEDCAPHQHEHYVQHHQPTNVFLLQYLTWFSSFSQHKKILPIIFFSSKFHFAPSAEQFLDVVVRPLFDNNIIIVMTMGTLYDYVQCSLIRLDQLVHNTFIISKWDDGSHTLQTPAVC